MTNPAPALILVKNGSPLTTSLLVAERFGKQHKNVLRNIEALIKDEPEFSRLNFEPISYPNKRGSLMARPRLAKSQLHDTPVTVRLNDELEAFFEGEARRRDVPLAIVLREYLVNQVRLVKAERLGKFQNELKAKPPP